MRRFVLFIFFLVFFLYGSAIEKPDLLQKEAQRINIAQSLVKNFSELDFPKYRDRNFWDNLPNDIRNQYIKNAEADLNYNWPTVKATDYLASIRCGDRQDEVYNAPRSVLTALVMGELTEGKGRFIDQIINGVWYYSEQTWWGWSAHFYLQKAPPGLSDVNEPTIDLGVGEMANI